jgi:Fe-S-cluster containining protein
MGKRLVSLYRSIDQLVAPISLYEWHPCKKDCGAPELCCEHSAFPVSQTEYEFMIEGLSMDRLRELRKRAKAELDRFYSQYGKVVWRYDMLRVAKHRLVCPFLENGNCSVYRARSIICRSYGACATIENGEKRVYGCELCRNAVVDEVRKGNDVLLPDFSEVERLAEGILKGRLMPIAAWCVEG